MQFTCQDLSAFSECQEIDFLSGKQAEFQVAGRFEASAWTNEAVFPP
jgi:hypothetical protein